jgi:UDP-2,3-diacylglucosamine hydrolase
MSVIYFISDLHLGSPNSEASLAREKEFVKWLDMAKQNAEEIYLVGDIFDFWFEYKRAVPRGFVRCLGKIAEITDSGIPVHWFTGNHDMWIFDYLPQECGVILHRKPIVKEYNGLRCYIGHGDGLGPGDSAYKFMKRFFDSSICQWLFARLHPNFGIGLASSLSGYSRGKAIEKDKIFHGEKEWLFQYCQHQEQLNHHDLYLFGHRHYPGVMKINEQSQYFNLGDWLHHFTFGVLDQNGFRIEKWKS